MAINIAKERSISDFLIPLNLDGRKPTEIGWMETDLTYISFHKSWSEGFNRLLKKLDSINAPRPLIKGKIIASKAYMKDYNLKNENEIIYSNMFVIKRIPENLLFLRFNRALSKNEKDILKKRWAFYAKDSQNFFAFSPPPSPELFEYEIIDVIPWKDKERIYNIKTLNIIKNLIMKSLTVYSLKKGLKYSENSKLYFPSGLFQNDKIVFKNYMGKSTFIQVTGERHAPTYSFRYYLSPQFKIKEINNNFFLQIHIGFHITSIDGTSLEKKKMTSRQKTLRKSLFNKDYLNRLIAISFYLSNGEPTISIGDKKEYEITIKSYPLTFESPYTIDETHDYSEINEFPDDEIEYDEHVLDENSERGDI